MRNVDDKVTDPRCPVILRGLTCRKQVLYIFQKAWILPVTTSHSVPDGLIYFLGKWITTASAVLIWDMSTLSTNLAPCFPGSVTYHVS